VNDVDGVAEMEGNDSSFPIDVDGQQQHGNLGGRGSDVDLTSADNSADIVAAAAMPLLLFVRRGSAAADHCRVRVPRS